MLKAMDISKSTYDFEIIRNDIILQKNKYLLDVIQQIFMQNKERYCVRRVYKKLVNRGYNDNHKRMQRIMNEAVLYGKMPKTTSL